MCNRIVQVTISIASDNQNDVTIYQNPITFGKERILITKFEERRLESKLLLTSDSTQLPKQKANWDVTMSFNFSNLKLTWTDINNGKSPPYFFYRKNTLYRVLAYVMVDFICMGFARAARITKQARNTKWKILDHGGIRTRYLQLTKRTRYQLHHETWYPQYVLFARVVLLISFLGNLSSKKITRVFLLIPNSSCLFSFIWYFPGYYPHGIRKPSCILFVKSEYSFWCSPAIFLVWYFLFSYSPILRFRCRLRWAD